MPSMNHAAVYSVVSHYLRAVAAAGTADNTAVVGKMRELPVQDVYTEQGEIRADGRMVHDMYLVRVKRPADSQGPWDYEEILQTVPGRQAFRPLAEAGCSTRPKDLGLIPIRLNIVTGMRQHDVIPALRADRP
jgi:branched-chain amino acid transport system substrate-binding protein